MSSVKTFEYGACEVLHEIRIAGSVPRVWDALVNETSAWWSRDYYTRPAAVGFVIEPRLGGHAYEDWGNGDGFVWYTVTGIRKGEMLRLSGELDLRHGPGHLVETFELKPDGDGTVLRFTEQTFGRATEGLRKSLDDGWKYLLVNCLQAYVETGAGAGGGAPDCGG